MGIESNTQEQISIAALDLSMLKDAHARQMKTFNDRLDRMEEKYIEIIKINKNLLDKSTLLLRCLDQLSNFITKMEVDK